MDIKNAGKKMKKIFKISVLFIGLLLTTGCPLEDLSTLYFYSSKDFDYYPHKDKFNIGDTLYIRFSFPRTINYGYYGKNEEIELNKDSYNVSFWFLLGKINNFNDTVAIEIYDYKPNELIEKIGNINDMACFIFDNESNKYVNEFGIILKEEGKFFFSNFYVKTNEFYFMIDSVLVDTDIKTYDNQISAPFYSTFQSTDKGWFEFEVTE